MILLTEISTRDMTPDMISYGQGVWYYSFAGDETYVDDYGVIFYWSGREQVFDVRGVVLGTTSYTEVASIASCISTTTSFYWDDDAKSLYVHHANNENDYTVGRNLYRAIKAVAGYASGTFPGQISYYPDLYFDPRLDGIGQLQKRVDPLKFGLLSFESSDYELANADGDLDDFSLSDALNSQVRFVLMDQGQTDINDGVRIFTGYTGGAKRNDESLTVLLQEARLFYNRSACPNVFDTTTYPNLDPKYENKRIPVAYGKIRRGICVPIDTASFDKATGGTVQFKIADTSLHAVLAIDALYDNDGNEVTISTSSLANGTIDFSVPADADLDLDKFSWRGQGYDIDGTYNNGLDIMKDVFAEQGSLAYGATTFDTTQWEDQTTENDESIGISVQSDRGLIEELIEPITISLQGIVDILGDGRVTFRPRQPNANVTKTYRKDQIIAGPEFEIMTDEVVSSIIVEYAPNFVDTDDVLSIVYDVNEESVTAAYGVKGTQPISPIKTVLTESADATAIGAEVALTSSDPQTIVRITVPIETTQVQLFEIVQVDIGRPQVESFEVYEVLERSLGIQDGEIVLGLALRHLPDRIPQFPAVILTESELPLLTESGLKLLTER